ncbi:tRNA ligase subunit PheS family protein, partial [Streptomyces flavovirens]
EMKTRLRPNYFPFTEPSAEMDMVCYVCRGESDGNPDRPCRTCGSEGWIELGMGDDGTHGIIVLPPEYEPRHFSTSSGGGSDD